LILSFSQKNAIHDITIKVTAEDFHITNQKVSEKFITSIQNRFTNE